MTDVSLSRPVKIGKLSQEFGEHPDWYKLDQAGRPTGLAGHEGLDYAVPVGTPVYAAHDGYVDQAHEEGVYGLHVVLRNDNMMTVYAHMSSVCVAPGQSVGRDVLIGYTGNSGRSSGPHLHFGWQVRGVNNPAYQNWLDPTLGRKANGDA